MLKAPLQLFRRKTPQQHPDLDTFQLRIGNSQPDFSGYPFCLPTAHAARCLCLYARDRSGSLTDCGPPSPIAGSLVPYSPLPGLRRNIKGMRRGQRGRCPFMRILPRRQRECPLCCFPVERRGRIRAPPVTPSVRPASGVRASWSGPPVAHASGSPPRRASVCLSPACTRRSSAARGHRWRSGRLSF